ncbi:MAG: putative metallopeptidase [Tepidibacter sp.]|jgi:predicted metallopeptidase|uniref:putative metallopeptidase n=1 Tax=Tepidibacter sp. TaxID=2529387 RepID=UPI0025F4DEA1|nr:putative metallopeptidase [Tepidibacter sp.]MCT4507923.1 putative metallopeptidase [Tepidibacter sp.]
MKRKLIIVDNDTGEELERVEFSGGYNVAVTNMHDGGNLRFIRKLDNAKYGQRHWIKNYLYKTIAEKLVERFPEIRHIHPRTILFIEDMEWKPTAAKQPWIARIKKANNELESMLGYEYVLETRNYYIERMSNNQVIALIYHELRHIDEDGSLKKHDIEDWSNMVATLGKDWATTPEAIENILGDDFEGWDDLRKAGRQISMFESLRMVK